MAVFARTIQSTNLWIKDMMRELRTRDRRAAYAALRAGLQVLRDRLTVAEAVQLGAQLPTFLRGVYYDGWQPASVPLKARRPADLYARLAKRMARTTAVDPARALDAVLKTIARHVDFGEVEDIKSVMPETLRSVWP
jgi:uncharacterized protein (DUF2267 family)